MRGRVFFLIVLVLGMTIIGCDNGSTNEGSDTWLDITELSQMDGKWKGSYSQDNIPVIDFVEQLDMSLDPLVQYMLADIKVAIQADIAITINARDKTQAISMTLTATLSGGSIAILWPMLKSRLGELEEEGITITTDDAKHALSITSDLPAEPMSDTEIAGLLNNGLQINRKGTKIKIPANIIIAGTPEIIFDKQ